MAGPSAWGLSWFTGWGDAWGAVEEEQPPPALNKSGGGKFIFRPSQPILFDDPVMLRQRDEDAFMLAAIL